MEEICTIIPLHVLMDMPKEVIFELVGKGKVRPAISVEQRIFVVEDASCEYTGTQEPRGLKVICKNVLQPRQAPWPVLIPISIARLLQIQFSFPHTGQIPLYLCLVSFGSWLSVSCAMRSIISPMLNCCSFPALSMLLKLLRTTHGAPLLFPWL